jgi:heparan-alpha-glucosaminide N-acetyltransferase
MNETAPAATEVLTTTYPGEKTSPPPRIVAPTRNIAVDAYRGFVMLLMMGEVLSFSRVARAVPDSWIWQTLGYHQSHVEWAGCSLHDMIQPSFSFLVGVALPYSIASRQKRGEASGTMFVHALWRSLILVALGIFLRSMHSPQTYFTFEDTLTQIGLGYPFLFLLGFRSPKWQWSAFAVILFGYWLAWALYPLPGPGFDYAAVGVPVNWSHNFTGFAAHWNKNANLGNAFDQWFLNLFPRTKPFVANDGGYLTLSFIPTLGTMLLGLAAGRWLRAYAPRIPMKRFLVAGVIGIAAGLLLHFTGICPIVKRIWTPAWVLFSGGICFLFLAAFSWVIEVKGYRRWAFPLVVVGMNSIAAYLIAHLFEDFVRSSLRIHLGDRLFQVFGSAYQPFVLGVAMLLIYWIILLWMYRRKLFLKV